MPDTSVPPALLLDAEIIPGLERFAREELTARAGRRLVWQPSSRPDLLRFTFSGQASDLLTLRSVVSVWRVLIFPVPRPRALLGHAHLTALLQAIAAVRALHPPGTFRTLRISAAGEESSVLTRLRAELCTALGLVPGLEEADLLLRLRRAPTPAAVWEVAIRLTPRPLAARAWRVCNLPGALNAGVAHAMMRLSEPAPGDRVLNFACGSGTLVIERLALAPARWAVAADRDPAALACARANLAAAGEAAQAALVQADYRALPFPTGVCDVLTADLPFGQVMGSHAENAASYPAMLAEAARVAAPGARLILITHEIRLLEGLLAGHSAWHAEQSLRIDIPFKSGAVTPRIYRLIRRPD